MLRESRRGSSLVRRVLVLRCLGDHGGADMSDVTYKWLGYPDP